MCSVLLPLDVNELAVNKISSFALNLNSKKIRYPTSEHRVCIVQLPCRIKFIIVAVSSCAKICTSLNHSRYMCCRHVLESVCRCSRIIYQQGDALTLLSVILWLDAAGISASISQLYCLEPHSGKQQAWLNHFTHFDGDSKNLWVAMHNSDVTISHSLLLLLLTLKTRTLTSLASSE